MSSIEVRDPTPQSLRGAAAEESNVEESNVEGSNLEEQAKEEAKSLLRDFEPPRYVSRKAINYKKALQRLQLATGTDVTILQIPSDESGNVQGCRTRYRNDKRKGYAVFLPFHPSKC